MSTVRIPLTQPIRSRTASTAKDSRSVNCYFEAVDQNNRDNIKRPGLLSTTITPVMAAGQAQGMYKCDSGDLWVVINNKVYIIDPNFTSTDGGTLTGDIQDVYFAESGNDAYLFMHNGTNGYVATENNPFVLIQPGMLYEVTIDVGGSGYVTPTCTFSAPPSGGTLATGTVNVVGGVVVSVTITNYGAGYVTAPTCTINPVGGGVGAIASVALNGFPSGAGALAAGAVYLDGYTVVATKLGQIFSSDPEYPMLWNPLNTVAVESDPDYLVAIVKHFNFIVAFGEWSTEFFYDAANASGSPFLRQDSYKNEIGCADGDSLVQFQQSVIYVGKSKTHGKSVYMLDGFTPKIISDQYIEKYLNADTNTNIQSFAFRIAGHTFYVMTLPNLDKTFVHDVDQKVWYEWTSYYSGAEHAFKVWTATEFATGVYGVDPISGALYQIDTETYTDNTQHIYWRVVTNNIDAGTRHRKFFESGEIIGDKVSGTMSINFSSDDYVNFSAVRTVLLDNPRSIIWQLGQSRYRAYQFLVTDDIPLRLSSFEMSVQGGEQASDPQLQAVAQQN